MVGEIFLRSQSSYLHIHFVCDRLQAFWAIRRHRPLDSDSLQPEQSQVSGEGRLCKAVWPHPHSGWFLMRRAARAAQTKACNKKTDLSLGKIGLVPFAYTNSKMYTGVVKVSSFRSNSGCGG